MCSLIPSALHTSSEQKSYEATCVFVRVYMCMWLGGTKRIYSNLVNLELFLQTNISGMVCSVVLLIAEMVFIETFMMESSIVSLRHKEVFYLHRIQPISPFS